MDYRKYITKSRSISAIGFGSWQLGNSESWSKMSEAEGVKLVKEALFEGVNFFDTAPNYGKGMSENILGKSFREKERSQIVINTKFGHNVKGKLILRLNQ